MLSVSDLNPTPRSCMVMAVSTRCLSERPSRSRRQVTRVSAVHHGGERQAGLAAQHADAALEQPAGVTTHVGEVGAVVGGDLSKPVGVGRQRCPPLVRGISGQTSPPSTEDPRAYDQSHRGHFVTAKLRTTWLEERGSLEVLLLCSVRKASHEYFACVP